MSADKATVITWIWWVVIGSLFAGLIALFTIPLRNNHEPISVTHEKASPVDNSKYIESEKNIRTTDFNKKSTVHYDDSSFKNALSQIPTIASWYIDDGTLVVFLFSRHQVNANRIAKTLCLIRNTHNAMDVEIIRIMDQIKYQQSGEFVVLLRRLC